MVTVLLLYNLLYNKLYKSEILLIDVNSGLLVVIICYDLEIYV